MADASNYPNVLPSDHDSDPKSPCASPDVVMTAPEVRPSHAEHQSQILEEQSNAHGDAHANLNIPKQRSRSPVASTHSNTSRNAINGVADNRSPPHTNGEHKSPDPLPKAISEDSEAETEILATPRKLQIRRLSDSSDDGHPVEPYSARKRRASGQPNVEHAEEAEGPHEFRSRKRARLHKNEDEEAWEEDTTSNEPEERERKPRLTRKAESESRIHTSKDDNLHLALDISRATTVPPKAFSTPTLPKPQPPSPTHRRDSSVHSSTTAPRPKDVDRNGRTPLARACHDGDAERVSTLIIAPNDMLNRPDYAGNTPLPLAVAKGHTEVVSMLIEAGADVNNVNHQGETPLKDAIDRGDVDVIGLLRRAGAVLKPPKESKPLDLPRHRRHFQHPSSAAALLDYINTDDDEGIGTCLGAEVTPNNDCVIAAVCSEKPHYLEMMLGFGGDCDPDPERVDNKTPMVVAIESGNLNAVQLLLQNGAHPRRLVFDDVDYKALIDDIGGQNSQEIGSLLDEALRNAPIRGKLNLSCYVPPSLDSTFMNSMLSPRSLRESLFWSCWRPCQQILRVQPMKTTKDQEGRGGDFHQRAQERCSGKVLSGKSSPMIQRVLKQGQRAQR